MPNGRKIIGVIPARLGSTRLPRKVLREIAGKAMVHWVYESAARSSLLDDLLVATDSDEVQQYCHFQNIHVLVTGTHPSGSDRIHEVMQRTDGDIYVNIQGDEPTVQKDHIDLLLAPVLAGETDVATLKVAIGREAAQDPNCVKVVTDSCGRALYFSRCPIPFDRDGAGAGPYYKHIGLYAYTRAALAQFHELPQSVLESVEKLEQLRYLENGIPIQVVETPEDTIGVDTEADLRKVAVLLAARAHGK